MRQRQSAGMLKKTSGYELSGIEAGYSLTMEVPIIGIMQQWLTVCEEKSKWRLME